MSKPPWTPGPWYVAMKPEYDVDQITGDFAVGGPTGRDEYDRDRDDGGVFAVIDDEPCTICVPWLEADARLIAAAPALAEALAGLAKACNDLDAAKTGEDYESAGNWFLHWRGKARAVLLAAGWPEGGSDAS